jgi:hypothetical protein
MFQAERDGSNEFNNYQPGSLNTTDQLIKDLNAHCEMYPFAYVISPI